jgi:hypothetical protein
MSIAGLKPGGKMKPIYMGMHRTEDLDGQRRLFEKIITKYRSLDPLCEYNPSTGRVVRFEGDCLSDKMEDEECPKQKYYDVQRELSRLDTRPLLTLFFSDARLAALNGFLNREGLVYSHL